MELRSYEELKELARRNDTFTGIDDDGVQHTIRWQRKCHSVNKNGVSGYCWLDGVGGRRIHVCAHDPCTARWPDAAGNAAVSKYGAAGPPDHHVRVPSNLALAPPIHATATSATAIPAPAGHEPTPPLPSYPAPATFYPISSHSYSWSAGFSTAAAGLGCCPHQR